MIDYTFMEITGFDSFVNDVREAFAFHKQELLSNTLTSAYSAKIIHLGGFTKLKKLGAKYSFLSETATILISQPNTESPVHIDGMRRPLVINVLISETNPDCLIKFYDYSMVEKTLTPDATYYNLISDEPIASYALMNNPIIVHTMMPHKITNPCDKTRMSISFNLKLDEYSLAGIYGAVTRVQHFAKNS